MSERKNKQTNKRKKICNVPFKNPWVKIDLSVCSTAKHGCSVAPLICLPEHTVTYLKEEKKENRVQIVKKNRNKSDFIIITLSTPEKAFGHNQLPIPNRKIKLRKYRYQ